jgi:CAAX protease family protein
VQRPPQPQPPVPYPPELPEGAERVPRWPPWYAGVGFLVGLTGTVIAVVIVAAATGTESGEESSTFTIVATLAQSAIFVGTAVMFASFTEKPRPWHFGLRPTRLWQAVGWAALGMAAFYTFTVLYSAAVRPNIDQGITESLGADQGTLGLIVAGIMIICVAPAAEEFFFRGFFYRALRTRYVPLAAAAIDGGVFGIIHGVGGSNALLVVPPLAVLGFVFCLVYEQTGSIFPTIALHAFNNAIAYGVQADGWEVSAVLGPLMLIGCVVVPPLIGDPSRRTVPVRV